MPSPRRCEAGLPERDHVSSRNYRSWANAQVIIDTDTKLVVAAARPVPGDTADAKAWWDSGLAQRCGGMTELDDGAYINTGLVVPHRRELRCGPVKGLLLTLIRGARLPALSPSGLGRDDPYGWSGTNWFDSKRVARSPVLRQIHRATVCGSVFHSWTVYYCRLLPSGAKATVSNPPEAA